MTANGVYTKEAVKEANRIMSSRNFHVLTSGEIAHSLATATVSFLLGAMTGPPDVGSISNESMHSEFDSLEFSLGGKQYSSTVLYKNINKDDQFPILIGCNNLSWPRSSSRDADTKPITTDSVLVIATGKQGMYEVIYGFPYLAKQLADGVEAIPGYVISKGDLICAEILPDDKTN